MTGNRSFLGQISSHKIILWNIVFLQEEFFLTNVTDHYRILKHPPSMIDNAAQISLQTIYDKLTELHTQLIPHPESWPRVYDNKALMSLLEVKDRYLNRLRDNGLLGYSRHSDKYWYTQADVDRFLSRCHFAPFGNEKI